MIIYSIGQLIGVRMRKGNMMKTLAHCINLTVCICLLCITDTIAQGLYVYDYPYLMEGASMERRLDTLKAMGFNGVVAGIANNPEAAKRYSDYFAKKKSGFQFPAAYTAIKSAKDAPMLKRALPYLGKNKTALWIIIRTNMSQKETDSFFLDMSKEGQKHGVPIVIYPHYRTVIETTAQAHAIMKRVNHPNLTISLHLCHLLRAGNEPKMGKIFHDYIRDVSLVSISGTDDVINFNPPKGDWSDAIKPLDEGDSYVVPFLKLLKQHNYQGPILLHTFGIKNNPNHLQRSLKHFRAFMSEGEQTR